MSIWNKLFGRAGSSNKTQSQGGSEVRTTHEGFSVEEEYGTACSVRFVDIKKISAYKRDRAGDVDVVNFIFETDEGKRYVVDGDLRGFANMLDAINRVLGVRFEDWRMRVLHPSFGTLTTTIWDRPGPTASAAAPQSEPQWSFSVAATERIAFRVSARVLNAFGRPEREEVLDRVSTVRDVRERLGLKKGDYQAMINKDHASDDDTIDSRDTVSFAPTQKKS